MKIVQTFWSGQPVQDPPGDKDLLYLKAGWLSPEYHWMSWALSCLQLKKLYGEVELVTDLRGKSILIDVLGLPYTKVSTELEGLLDTYPPECWALAKIYSYSIQKEPFIHIDGDVFLWERFSDEILRAGLVSQNRERNLSFYQVILDEIHAQFGFIPSLFAKERYEGQDLFTANAGIIGGHNLEFIATYCQAAFGFIDRNREYLQKVNTPHLNFIFEQYLLFQLAEQEGAPITYFMKETVDNPVFRDYVRFEDYPFIPMIHPVGGFKKMQHICNHLAKKLRNDYPVYYHRVMSTFEEEERVRRDKISTTLHPLITGAFARTRAAVAWLNANLLSEAPAALSPEKIEGPDFAGHCHSLLSDGVERDCLLELYTFEALKSRVFHTYIEDLKALEVLREDDQAHYALIQRVFGSDPEEILNTALIQDHRIAVLETNWGWRYESDEQIGPIIEKNFKEPRAFGQVVFIPSPLQAAVEEYYLDELDMILVDACSEKKKIGEIMEVVKPYFDADELNSNLPAFTKLLTDSLKRLLYRGILKIAE